MLRESLNNQDVTLDTKLWKKYQHKLRSLIHPNLAMQESDVLHNGIRYHNHLRSTRPFVVSPNPVIPNVAITEERCQLEIGVMELHMPSGYFAVFLIFPDRFRNHPTPPVATKLRMLEMRVLLQGNLDLQLQQDLLNSTTRGQSNRELAANHLRLRFDLH